MNRGVLTKVGAACVAFIAGVALIAPSSAARYRRTDTIIAPGVVFSRIKDPRGPWRIRVVDIDLAQASTIEPVLATERLPGAERTSSMAARYGAIAAINGDYARESGRPVMLFARDGELVQTALTRGVNFAVNSDETDAFIRHVVPTMWLHENDSGFDHIVNLFNAGWPGADQIAGYNALGGRDEKPPYGACSARLYPNAGPRTASTRPGMSTPFLIDEVVCKDGRMWPKGGTVVSTPVAGGKADEIQFLQPGEGVEFGWSLDVPGIFETLGGNPTLVRDGELFIGSGTTPFFRRHPRTGVAITDDNHILFVTVDGRDPGRSVGMTPAEFGRLFRQLGATYALNLDGGGSTTMVVNGEIVNKPSDGSERFVSSALVLLPGPDPQPTANPNPNPTPTATPQPTPSIPNVLPDPDLLPGTLWETIATDPASTGGLADWLRSEGIRLRGSLREAAWLFSHLR